MSAGMRLGGRQAKAAVLPTLGFAAQVFCLCKALGDGGAELSGKCTSVLSSPLQQHWWVGVKAGVRAGCACAEHAVVARCHHLSLEITSPLFCWSWRRLTLYEKSEAELTIPSRFLVCLSSFPGSKLFLDKAKQQSCSSRWQQGSILPLEHYPQWSMKTL